MIIGRKGIEPLTALAIEFTAQPVIPTNGTFLYIFFSLKGEGRMGGIVNIHKSRATSTTRTIFRLNTN